MDDSQAFSFFFSLLFKPNCGTRTVRAEQNPSQRPSGEVHHDDDDVDDYDAGDD